MDIPVQRNRSPLARYRRWIFTAAIVGGTLALTTVALGRLRAEPPSVARAGLWFGTVDVALTGALPKGARPDPNVVGTVELERLADVLHVRRPAYAQPDSTVGLPNH